MAESIVNEASATTPNRNDMFDAAHLKLGTAQAIVDVVVMLNVGGNMDTLNKGSLTACLLHADELLGEARQMFMDAHAQTKAVNHG
jgi:hypothetical protein